MNRQEIVKKAERGEALTVKEVKIYQASVKPSVEIYGKYGTLAKKYLEEENPAKYWSLAGDLSDYLHGVDKAAERLFEAMYAKLSASEQYRKTGNFLHDLRMETEIRNRIDEEILQEIVYVN